VYWLPFAPLIVENIGTSKECPLVEPASTFALHCVCELSEMYQCSWRLLCIAYGIACCGA
jgi:hypothetical protein